MVPVYSSGQTLGEAMWSFGVFVAPVAALLACGAAITPLPRPA